MLSIYDLWATAHIHITAVIIMIVVDETKLLHGECITCRVHTVSYVVYYFRDNLGIFVCIWVGLFLSHRKGQRYDFEVQMTSH